MQIKNSKPTKGKKDLLLKDIMNNLNSSYNGKFKLFINFCLEKPHFDKKRFNPVKEYVMKSTSSMYIIQ